MDRSRIETHIKPLLGAWLVSALSLRDIEGMQADIAMASRREAVRQAEAAIRLAAPELLAAPLERCAGFSATRPA